jgi:hypothetical protein
MSYNTKLIARDGQNNPVPQYYNPVSDQYEVVQGANGVLYVLDSRVVKDVWSGTSGSATHTIAAGASCSYFEISNDGSTDLTFTIGALTFTVKTGESFGDNFSSFSSVAVSANGNYRAYAKG